MRLVSTHSLQSGEKIGKPITNDQGQILVQEGVNLTTRMINRLKILNITFIYIEDEESEGIEPTSTLHDQTKTEAIQDIKQAFGSLGEESSLSKSFILDRLGRNFKKTVKNILMDVRESDETISLLSDTIGHDRYTFYHSLNVAIYSIAMARELKFSEEEQLTVGVGALLHDIGKTEISSKILQKADKLTPEEMTEVKKHPEIGFDILRKCFELSTVSAHCAFQHHERIDGNGYPRGIKGNDIHPYAKIIAIADVFGAVTSNRVYSKAILPHEGMELMFAGAGTQFDLKMIQAFRKTVAIYPVGLTVILNDGRKALVVQQHKLNSERPVVRIIEENNEKVSRPYYVDLNKQLTVTIVDTETTLSAKEKKLVNRFYF
ncbi:HD-GYP domain-containing protein [Salipaludibacillus daqingensis]|uniref:HD-GYP domain-containing protein n=1 Tax=Salipaludibacillus daqingensis TaxID=3041001 RepID=UPI0024761D53|nr:HD-GYP domain-containing protein [Salipaludibacillus daqingensis]